MSGIAHRYQSRLPTLSANVSLGEGNTPLLPLLHLPAAEGFPSLRLWVKVEGANPTGSFKDRGMAIAVSAALSEKRSCVICASTGNTSASAAAYAGRANLACIVLIPAGKIAAGKLAQAVAHGAEIVQIDGNFDDAMLAVRNAANNGSAAIVNSINPYRLQGQKTAAFEVIEQLGRAPDFHALPVGNAGNITAHWIGYSEAAGRSTSACLHCGGDCPHVTAPIAGGETPPTMLGYQAAGSAPFVFGTPVVAPETIASAIRIGNPQSFDQANIVLADSGGHVAAVSDEEILRVQNALAKTEGIFCEPASATSVAGVLQDARAGKLPTDATIVCTLTGHGLKDPDIFAPPKTRVVPSAQLADIVAQLIHARQ